jgi:aspartokinase
MEVYVRNTFNPDSPGTRVTSHEDGSGIRCVALRRNLDVEGPCIGGHKSQAATVVCIGSPEKPDSARGLTALKEAGVKPLHYGLATVGLVYVVREREAEEALRVLHGELVREANALVEEEAV